MKLFLEGTGAGYTIEAQDISYISGKNIKVESVSSTELILTGNFKFKVGTLSAESYYYNTGDISDVDCIANKLNIDIENTIITDYFFEKAIKPDALKRIKNAIFKNCAKDYDWATADDVKLADLIDVYSYHNDSIIYNYLTSSDFDIKSSVFMSGIDEIIDGFVDDNNDITFVYGGGYSHSTYDGQIMSIEDNDFADMYVDDSTENGKQIIEYIDKAVQGDNISVVYEVYIDNDFMDEFYNDDDEDAENKAIAYAKDYIEHNEVQNIDNCYVQRVEWLELFDGTDYNTNMQDSEIVWNDYEEYELDNDEF